MPPICGSLYMYSCVCASAYDCMCECVCVQFEYLSVFHTIHSSNIPAKYMHRRINVDIGMHDMCALHYHIITHIHVKVPQTHFNQNTNSDMGEETLISIVNRNGGKLQ